MKRLISVFLVLVMFIAVSQFPAVAFEDTYLGEMTKIKFKPVPEWGGGIYSNNRITLVKGMERLAGNSTGESSIGYTLDGINYTSISCRTILNSVGIDFSTKDYFSPFIDINVIDDVFYFLFYVLPNGATDHYTCYLIMTSDVQNFELLGTFENVGLTNSIVKYSDQYILSFGSVFENDEYKSVFYTSNDLKEYEKHYLSDINSMTLVGVTNSATYWEGTEGMYFSKDLEEFTILKENAYVEEPIRAKTDNKFVFMARGDNNGESHAVYLHDASKNRLTKIYTYTEENPYIAFGPSEVDTLGVGSLQIKVEKDGDCESFKVLKEEEKVLPTHNSTILWMNGNDEYSAEVTFSDDYKTIYLSCDGGNSKYSLAIPGDLNFEYPYYTYVDSLNNVLLIDLLLSTGERVSYGYELKNIEDRFDLILKDINDDGKVNQKDVTILSRHLAGGWEVTLNEGRADIFADQKINQKDITYLSRYLAGGWI